MVADAAGTAQFRTQLAMVSMCRSEDTHMGQCMKSEVTATGTWTCAENATSRSCVWHLASTSLRRKFQAGGCIGIGCFEGELSAFKILSTQRSLDPGDQLFRLPKKSHSEKNMFNLEDVDVHKPLLSPNFEKQPGTTGVHQHKIVFCFSLSLLTNFPYTQRPSIELSP